MNTKVKGRKKLAATEARNLRTLLLLSVFEPDVIASRIAQARIECGLTQEEAADLVGVSTRSWQGYEAGVVTPYRHMGKISEVTGRPMEWLLHGDQQQAPLGERVQAEIVERLDHIEQQLERLVSRSGPDDTEDPVEPSGEANHGSFGETSSDRSGTQKDAPPKP